MLDCWIRPGVSASDFERLITRCERCELIMTRRVFAIHECARRIQNEYSGNFTDDGDESPFLFHMDEI